MLRARTFWLLPAVLALTLAVAAWRIQALSMMEPRVDQAFFAWWMKNLALADHFWPQRMPGESLLTALQGDSGSALHHLLRNLYNKPTSVLTLAPVAALWLVAKLGGSAYHLQAAAGIVAGCLALPALGLFPWWGPGGLREKRNADVALGLLALILAAASFYLTLFSPFGIHNFGIASLIAAVAATQAWINKRRAGEHGGYGLMACLQLLALFSHWTNVFLLPPATFLAIWLSPLPHWRARFALSLRWSAIMAVVALAVLPFLLVEDGRGSDSQTHSLGTVVQLYAVIKEPGGLLLSLAHGARLWLLDAAGMFSALGFVLALVGLTLLWRRAIRLPLILLAAHFLVYSAMPGFSDAHLRTFPYVLPLLCLGLAATLCEITLLIRGGAGKAAAAVLAAAHLWVQWPALHSWREIETLHPDAWDFYYRGQGEVRALVSDLNAALPDGALLLTWPYDLNFAAISLGDMEKRGVVIPSAMDGLWLRHELGALNQWLSMRRVDLSGHEPIFLAVDDQSDLPSPAELERRMSILLGDTGLGLRRQAKLVSVREWAMTSAAPTHTILYQVVEAAH